MNTKICWACKRELPETEFSKKGTGFPDGRQSMCNTCYKEYRRQRSARVKEARRIARIITDCTAEELFAELSRHDFQFTMTYAPNTETAEESVE